MADIALRFESARSGDLAMDGRDLARDDGLETAALLSLFTDRRATVEQLPTGFDLRDLRGWWGDSVAEVTGDQFGSLLWTLAREKQTTETLAKARGYVEQALAWMVEDRVTGQVSVATQYVARGVMRIDVEIERPQGVRIQYRFDYEWAGQAARAG
ncbi:phage GP46 family protein [Lysobacter sp. LF1]|uniref:Phage GP46 family protein n=1 Tax=Lysobacter stagni TaxID=3045172 RepID=A0ABT6XKN8_9GAMM|nr:phage GP46 family protein [Lysobacter sp. LF1]MDI9240731.1 phage GP46 family protein [Lysobacter sp. LF1]